jgi:hypothetical protein
MEYFVRPNAYEQTLKQMRTIPNIDNKNITSGSCAPAEERIFQKISRYYNSSLKP